MTTEARLKSAAEFLAGEVLMGWDIIEEHYEYEETSGVQPTYSIKYYRNRKTGEWFEEVAFWHPYTNDEKGLWQCLGKGGVVEKMLEKGWHLVLDNETVLPEEVFYTVQFYNSNQRKRDTPVSRLNKCEAITLSAATALGWKEE